MPNGVALPILPMRPLLAEKIWGGRRLSRYASKGAPPDKAIGESWEVADLDEGTSTIASGPYEGRTLHDVTRAHGRALYGRRARGDAFPLLVKIIDAADDLSVQVHPGPGDVQRFEGARSKDEAWLILEREDDARLLHGCRPGVTRERFRQGIVAGEADKLLREVRVQPGDVVRVSPGLFHAIGRGTLLVEVQEPSDTTFRVWDFGRVGLDGQPRPLHVEEALSVGRFGDMPPEKVTPVPLAPGHELLVDAPGYRMERLSLGDVPARRLALSGDTAVVVLVTRGEVALRHGAQEEVRLSELQSAVVPASMPLVDVRRVTAGAALVLAGLGGPPLVELR